jgi:hypothetical protein
MSYFIRLGASDDSHHFQTINVRQGLFFYIILLLNGGIQQRDLQQHKHELRQGLHLLQAQAMPVMSSA